MTNPEVWYDGPTVALTAGTWHITDTITLDVGTGAGTFAAQLWDGTTPND